MDHLIIEKFRYAELNQAVDILTEAFITNPAYSIIFKKKDQLKDGLRWLFRTNLLLINEKEILTQVVKEKSTGNIIGIFTIIPPGGVKNTSSIYSKIGLPGFIFKFGINSLIRMLRMSDYNKKLLADSIGVPQYYYLSMVVIKKEYRGTGVGTYALKHAIEKLISSRPTCPFMGLTTQLPENVIFYSRLEFSKLDEGLADYKGDTYYNCNMRLKLY